MGKSRQIRGGACVVALLAAGGCADPQPPPPIPTAALVGFADPEPAVPTTNQPVSAPAPLPAPPGGARFEPGPRQPISLRVAPLARALLAPALEREFEAATPRWDLVRLRSTDRAAIDEVARGRADAAVVGIPLTRQDIAAGVTGHLLGYHVAALVVAPENPVSTLTNVQMRDALTGRVTEWNTIAYHSGPLRLSLAPDGPAQQRLIALLLPGGRLSTGAIRTANSGAVARGVAGDPQSMGVVALATLAGASAGAGARPVAVHGVTPSLRTAATGEYPFACPLLLVHPARPSPGVRSLLEFAASPAGRALLGSRLTAR